MQRVNIDSLAGIDKAAGEIVAAIGRSRVVCLYGAMGSGKTTLIRAICARLGVNDTVTSPTFALVNEYRNSNGDPVYHFDFYRINSIEEIYDFGYEEYFYGHSGICLIEWPELLEDALPTENVARLTITVNPDMSRTVEISAR